MYNFYILIFPIIRKKQSPQSTIIRNVRVGSKEYLE